MRIHTYIHIIHTCLLHLSSTMRVLRHCSILCSILFCSVLFCRISLALYVLLPYMHRCVGMRSHVMRSDEFRIKNTGASSPARRACCVESAGQQGIAEKRKHLPEIWFFLICHPPDNAVSDDQTFPLILVRGRGGGWRSIIECMGSADTHLLPSALSSYCDRNCWQKQRRRLSCCCPVSRLSSLAVGFCFKDEGASVLNCWRLTHISSDHPPRITDLDTRFSLSPLTTDRNPPSFHCSEKRIWGATVDSICH